MTLLELVIAMAVFGTMMLGIASMIGTGLAVTRTNRNRTVAANLAAQEMDEVRSADFTTLAAGSEVIDVDGVPYTVTREVTWVATSATSGPCDGTDTSPELLRVRISVTWNNMRAIAPVVSDTTLTPPAGVYDPNTGHVSVKVIDRDAEPVFTVPVSVSGPISQSTTTNIDGCAFLGFLPAGTYTVSLNAAGFVDRQSNATPTQTVGVTVGNVTSVQFDYDEAATLSLTPLSALAYAVPADVPLTIANDNLIPTQTKVFAGTGIPRSIPSMFPFLSGYQAWTGSCADADPEGDILDSEGLPIGDYWPGAMREPAIAVEAGDTSAANVHMHDGQIHVQNSLAVALAGVTVVATHAADSVCGTGETLTLGITDAGGNLNVAIPFGTWTISVSGLPPATTWSTIVIDPNGHAPVPNTAVTL
ncbi:MAG: hypothetical protein SGJ13_13775 [Actinomycetota bacterium]|nr:hypothetical protein [Actinomycetota bacterium]